MRIRMLRTRSFTVPTDRRISFRYKAGCWYTVKRDWGQDMVAAGDAEEITEAAGPAAPRTTGRRRRKAAV